jgi:uncharacterized protein YndB with AHSA1/START domain
MGQTTATNFSEFKLRVNIKTSIENAYKAWATPAGLESWFLRRAFFTGEKGAVRESDAALQDNDEYIFHFHGYPDSMAPKGKVLKTNGKNLFSFSFSKGCPVTISIFSEQDETIVELFESQLPTDEQTIKSHYIGDSKGWIFYLTNLKSVLEGGLDLRNKKMELKNVITA